MRIYLTLLQIKLTLGIPTYAYFNNYDISFHNEIWSTAMSGFLGAGSTWFTNVVHRRNDENPYEIIIGNIHYLIPHEIGEPITNFVIENKTGTGTTIVPLTNDDDKIKSCYHNFKSLSDFISLLASNNFFDQNLTPYKYYKYDPDNFVFDVIESYYLVNEGQTFACGWIHNINKYWANSYLYTDQNNGGQENYYGCEREGLIHPPAPSFEIEGFVPNHPYWIEFFHTRWGSEPLPASYGVLSDNDGKILIDMNSAPLACDSFNADYAFTAIVVPSPQRMAQGANEKNENNIEAMDFSIYPNPSIGEARITLHMDENSELTIHDITGRIVKKIMAASQNSIVIDFATFSKGLYIIKLKNSLGEKIKRLIIQ